jgi:glycosyltransferase involved in cell wall biosynthesis
MPAHNEAAHIEHGVCEWYESVVAKVPDSELLIVDDCSTDDTLLRLRALEQRLPKLRVLQMPSNGGHGRAVRMALDSARGDFAFQTDSDRQHSPEDFWLLWNQRTDVDFVFGVRESRADGMVRLLISRTMRVANALIWGHWIADANCPFKLMRRGPLGDVLDHVPTDAFIPMVMVSILARRRGYRVVEVRVRHFPRTAGQQSLAGTMKWMSIGRRCLRELIELRFSISRSRKPQLERAMPRAKLD